MVGLRILSEQPNLKPTIYESRKYNVLVGNVPEKAGETFADVEDKVEGVFRDNLNIACRTSQVRRLGKKQEGKHRLLLADNGR